MRAMRGRKVPLTVAWVGILVLMSPLFAHAESLSKSSQAVAKSADVVESCGGESGLTEIGEVYLTEYTSPVSAPNAFYARSEGLPVTATVRIGPGDCQPPPTVNAADYQTVSGVAQAGTDFTAASGRTGRICDDNHWEDWCIPFNDYPRFREVSVQTHHDIQVESAVEPLMFSLTGAERDPPGVGSPSSVPMYIIDDDGPERFSLESLLDGSRAVTYRRGELSSGGGIILPVFRAGSASSPASVDIELRPIGSDPAQPGSDFLQADPATFAANQRIAWTFVSIVNDKVVEEDETFQLSLVDGGDEPDSTVVTILDNDEPAPAPGDPPVGRLHHPKHEFKYPQNYPLIREIHVFTASSDDDFPVFKTELALRKRLKSGRCVWWDGNRFVNGSCSTLRWSERLFRKVAPDFFEYRVKELPLSVGKSSGVRDYKLWSRAWDEAGRDSQLLVGRNVSRFDIIKRCRDPYNVRKCKPVRPTQ
jgi:hypothetical protein